MKNTENIFPECGKRGGVSGAAHVKKGIWVPLFIQSGAFVHCKSQVLIESESLRVLLVDGNFPDGKGLNAEFKHGSAEPVSAGFRGKKEHFQTVSVDAHETGRFTCGVFGEDQVRDSGESLRNVFADPENLRFRKEKVCGADRLFSKVQKFLKKEGGAFAEFVNFHEKRGVSKAESL